MTFFQRITFSPKKRAATLFGLGCCATLSLPPFFLLPFLALSSCGWLVLLLRAETPGQAFRTGWWWGLGFFVSGLYWICISLLVDAERFAWMIPFALFGLNGLIAIFPALASVGFFYLFYSSPCRGEARRGESEARSQANPPPPQPSPYGGGSILHAALLFTICWSVSEFARSVLFTGFPWNLVGYGWGEWPVGMQFASIVGIHGLTLLTMLLSFVPLHYKRGEKQAANRIVFVWMLILAWGMWRLDYAPIAQTEDQPTVRVVQAAIPQSLKWDPKQIVSGIRKHMALTIQAEEEKGAADIIVWPESAVPLAINREPLLERDLRSLLTDDQLLITGSIRFGESLVPNKPAIYNSVYTLNKDVTLDIYDKHHLVPFGEFVPLRHVLPIDKITPGDTDYSRGLGPQTITPLAGALPFSPLVCYEAIFASGVVAKHQTRPAYLLNVTNDAWFGTSTGPYQHLHMTRFRAVEQGLPLVRAANTGVSAVIDSYGKVVDSIPLNQDGTIDVVLPRQIEPTIYARLGNWCYIGMIALLCLITMGYMRYRHLKS